jgi:hypothetical protein
VLRDTRHRIIRRIIEQGGTSMTTGSPEPTEAVHERLLTEDLQAERIFRDWSRAPDPELLNAGTRVKFVRGDDESGFRFKALRGVDPFTTWHVYQSKTRPVTTE